MSFSNQSNFHVRTIKSKGVELEVEFRFYQAIPATKDEPESPEELWIESVWLDDFDITHLLGPKAYAEIEAELLKLYDNKEE